MQAGFKSLASVGALITIGMLAGRMLGLLREIMIAARFGASAHADIAIALLIIPDFVTSIFIGSAASAVLIPAFAARDRESALALFWQAFIASLLVFTGLAALLYLAEPTFADAMYHADTLPDLPQAFGLMLLSLPLTAGTAIVTAYLQYSGRFAVPAFANAIFNTGILVTLWFFPGGVAILACGILAAAFIRLLAHGIAFYKNARPWTVSLKPWQLRKRLVLSYAAAAGSGTFSMLPQYIPYFILAASGFARFNYALKLILLPGMLGLTVIQLVVLPWLVKTRQSESRLSIYRYALQLTWITSLAASLALMYASGALARLCFGYGQMTDGDIATISHLFSIGVWAVPGMWLTGIWQQIWFAHENTHFPLIASMTQSAFIAVACVFGYSVLGGDGVMEGFAIGQYIPLAVLAAQAGKRGIAAPGLPSFSYFSMATATVAAFLVLACPLQGTVLPPLAAVAVYGLIGIVAMGCGLVVNPAMRQWACQQMKRA